MSRSLGTCCFQTNVPAHSGDMYDGEKGLYRTSGLKWGPFVRGVVRDTQLKGSLGFRTQATSGVLVSIWRAGNAQLANRLSVFEFERRCYAGDSDARKPQEDLEEQRKQQNAEYLKGDTVAPGKFGDDASDPVQVNLGLQSPFRCPDVAACSTASEQPLNQWHGLIVENTLRVLAFPCIPVSVDWKCNLSSLWSAGYIIGGDRRW